ncbi:DUF6777 domain-containing protein [Streptomyces sp900105245]|uniref:DUF6777 domain-containing protein n=1 Tax=Streptomyces sp. 900105245 TaxID=3154379 RepID=A0ABV1UHA2_9ACTN
MPRVVAATAAVIVAVVLAVVFTRGGGGSSAKGGEVFLQSAGSTGQDPYTPSTARQNSAAPEPAVSAMPTTGAANEVRGVEGGAPGLYTGTKNVPACDVEKQITYLRADPAKNRSFASASGVQPSGVPAYLRSLTPVQLRVDTRVTDHGYRPGSGTAYQAVLQAGTAVLVDGHGVPRVRCASGNPLTPPVAQRATPKIVGQRWSAYSPARVVVVTPAARPVKVFVLFDTRHDDWIHRERGDHECRHDRHAQPPVLKNPWNAPRPSGSPTSPPNSSTSPSSPSSPSSASPSESKPSGSKPSGSKPSGSKPSESKPSESKSSESKSPESGSKTPESKTPESKTPESKSPESKTPESKTPESKTPESKTPESKTPESKPPESKPPESKTPESKNPESKTPESKTPESKPPESKPESAGQAPTSQQQSATEPVAPTPGSVPAETSTFTSRSGSVTPPESPRTVSPTV